MFIWTISDVIGLIAFGFVTLFFGTLFLIIRIQDWRMKRRKRS